MEQAGRSSSAPDLQFPWLIAVRLLVRLRSRTAVLVGLFLLGLA
jgi:hypothetical protein